MSLQAQSFTTRIHNREVHARILGHGPPIMLFHASPMNSTSLLPICEALASKYTCIAVDTPGYGRSERPEKRPEHIADYAQRVEELRRALGVARMAIYGTATGAQIAVRYGIMHPSRVDHIFLDNVAHFSTELARSVMEDYFPDLTPLDDGSHLELLWDIVTHLFRYFPWCWKRPQHALRGPMPPVHVLHQVALLYMDAGPEYDWAYRLAFQHERREYLTQLTVPTTIFRWDHSIVKSYTDRIFEIELPRHIRDRRIHAGEDRYTAMAKTIGETYKGIFSTLPELHDDEDPKMAHVMSDPFPQPEMTGRYLREAWAKCSNAYPTRSPKERTQLITNWAKQQ